MAKLSELQPETRRKVLVFGDSGTGKSCFATSFPGPTFVHDFDNKIGSAASYWKVKNPAQLNDIDYTNYSAILGKDTKDTTKARYASFWGWVIEMQQLANKGEFPYKTIVLDSMTMWSELLLKEILRQTEGKINGPIAGRPDVPGMQHYGVNSIAFKDHIGQFLALPCNVVVTAHIDVTKDESTGEVVRRPYVSGRLATYLPIIFSEVYRAYTVVAKDGNGKIEYLAQTRTDPKFSCRTEIPGLPNPMPLEYKSLVKTY